MHTTPSCVYPLHRTTHIRLTWVRLHRYIPSRLLYIVDTAKVAYMLHHQSPRPNEEGAHVSDAGFALIPGLDEENVYVSEIGWVCIDGHAQLLVVLVLGLYVLSSYDTIVKFSV